MSASSVGKIFIRGLAAVLPIAVTLYVLWWLATTAEASLGRLARSLLGESWYVPGTGVVLGFALVFGAGLVMQAVAVRRLYKMGEGLLEKLPLVKTIYGPLKDLMRLMASTADQRGPSHAVRVTMPGVDASLLGFQTRDDASTLTGDPGDTENVAVYFPMSYQIGGYMVFVPKSWITKLDWTAEDVLRVTLTAGMSQASALGGDPEIEEDSIR